MMFNCIFCDIINGDKPGYIVYKDDKIIVLLDIFPSVEGHLMVIPKRHGETILDFSKKELGKIFTVAQKMIKTLEKTYKTKSFSVGINHGEWEGVPHLHVHILPRFKGDGGGIIQSLVKKEIKESLENIVNKIKKNI